MSEEQYHSASHCKYLTQYHIIWCPKFRFSVLQNGADDTLPSLPFIPLIIPGSLRQLPELLGQTVKVLSDEAPAELVLVIQTFRVQHPDVRPPLLHHDRILDCGLLQCRLRDLHVLIEFPHLSTSCLLAVPFSVTMVLFNHNH